MSIIVATKNEEKSISYVIEDIQKIDLDDFEILVVDKSTDRTRELVRRLTKKYYNLRLIEQKDNGKGNALKLGVRKAKGNIICFLDGDCTYPAKFIPRMVELLRNHDMVIASRLILKEGASQTLQTLFIYRFIGFLGKFIFRKFKTSEPTSGMRVMRKETWNKMNLKSRGFVIEIEMEIRMAELGLHVAEIPIPCLPRRGNSKFNWSWGDMLRMIKLAQDNSYHLDNLTVDVFLE
ncbi:MAG: glycosyltransferase family 2 protein [Candidatus Hodarchaeota archaeon]